MPRRLMCVAPGALQWEDYEEATLEIGQVRVRAEFGAAKHGTEMALFKGYGVKRGIYDPGLQLFRAPVQGAPGASVPVGNMLVGHVIEASPQTEILAVGDRVCLYSGFRETCVANERDCWKMSEEMSWRSAVCLDPADFALGAIRDGHVRVGDAVAVFGLGAIGLMVIQMARLAGAFPIIAVDPLPNRRDVAEKLGVDMILDPAVSDAGLEIKRATGSRGVDVAIDYSGAAQAVQDALRCVAFGGTVVLGSSPAPYGTLDFGREAHRNIPNIVFSRACSQPDRDHPRWTNDRIYSVCWRLLCQGALTGEPIVQPVVAFGDLQREYPRIATNPEDNVKLGASF